MSENIKVAPPQATTAPHSVSYHGDTRTDEYAWLRDDNWQAVMKQPDALDADIRAHLEAENAYTDAVMAPTQSLQTTLFDEMRGRLEDEDASVPVNIGTLSWATRYVAGGEHVLVCYGPPDAKIDDMQTVLDGNIEAADRAYFKLAGHAPSPDGALLAWSFDDKGSEYFTICVRKLTDAQDMTDRLTDTAVLRARVKG